MSGGKEGWGWEGEWRGSETFWLLRCWEREASNRVCAMIRPCTTPVQLIYLPAVPGVGCALLSLFVHPLSCCI